jgi:hypothetical protein
LPGGLVPEHGNDFLIWLVGEFGSLPVRIGVVLFVLAIGGAATWWKRSDQFKYGCAEVIFGAIGSGAVISYVKVDNLFTPMVGLISSVCVASRGFNNVLDGMPEEMRRTQKKERRAMEDVRREEEEWLEP